MLEWRIRGTRYRVSLLFPALVTALLLCYPDGVAASCLLASLVHEGGHLLKMLTEGVVPKECVLGAFGMRIRLDDTLIGYRSNIRISLAGPLANGVAACVLLLCRCPMAAATHLVLAALNLLPVSALDGGEILRCCLCLMGKEAAVGAVLRLSSALVLLPLATISFWIFFNSGNPSLLVVGVYLATLLIFSSKNEKNS